MKKALILIFILFGAYCKLNSQCSVNSAPTNNCGAGDYIDTFVLNGTPAVGVAGCSGASGYSFYPTPVWNLQVGNSYTWSATCSGGIWNEGITIWIDLNNDGFYSNTELVSQSSPATTHIGTITIPFGATIANNVRMRVRDFWNTNITANDACLNGSTSQWGETQDHLVNIICPSGAASLSIAATSTLVCLGGPVTLTATGAQNFSWSSGISNAVSFTPSASQSYTVTGSIASCSAATSNAVITVSVTSTPVPVSAVVSPTVVCAGSPATITASGANNFTYTPGPSSQSGPNTTLAVNPFAATVYTIKGYNGNGCPGTTTISLAVNPIPTITVVNSTSLVCAGQSATLTASGAQSYSWQPGGPGASIVVSPSISTAYNITGTNVFNCSAGITTVVIVAASPTVTANTNKSLVCPGGGATLTAGGANSYSWTAGPSGSVYAVNPTSTTTYSVVGTNTSGCEGIGQVIVNVPQLSLTLNSNPNSVCIGNTATLTASGANTYTWFPGSIPLSQITSSLSATTVYSVNAISNFSNSVSCPHSGMITVTVNPNPVLIAAANPTIFCRFYDKTTFSVTGASSYLWSSATNPNISISSTFSLTFSQSGIQTISVTGTDPNGCQSTSTVQVKVVICSSGLEDLKHSGAAIIVYPNPNNGSFSITANVAVDLFIINTLGQVVKKVSLSDKNGFRAEVNDLETGIYYFMDSGGNSGHQKISVER
jgi:hypothetical protein